MAVDIHSIQIKLHELEKEIKHLKYVNSILSSTVENCPAAIYITDRNGVIEFINPYAELISGYKANEIIGRTPKIFQSGHHNKEFYNDLWKTISSGEIWRGEFYNKRKNGELYWEESHIAPIKNEDGVITNFVAIKVDITERISYEQKLKELNATKDKFFSIIAHDLKNPFNALLSFTEMLNNGNHEMNEKSIKNIVNLLNDSAKTTYNLLENLLNWALSQTGKLGYNPKVYNINEIINTAIQPLLPQANVKNIKIENETEKNFEILADFNLLNTVIRNLVSNGIKYTNEGGTIRINVEKQENYYLVSIIDSGIGITEDVINKLFKIDIKYSTDGTNSEKGTGLGLILCKEFVEMQGGKIWVESEIGKGSCFKFSIPISHSIY